MARLSITAKFKNIKKGMFSPQVAGRLSRKQLEKGMTITLSKARDLAKANTPRGGTGVLRDSIKAYPDIQVSSHIIQGRVAWEAPYADAVDQGAPPRFVPIAPLKVWAAAVLGNEKAAYAVQHKISLEGTPGQGFVDVTKQQVEVRFRKNIERMAAELATDLEKDF